MFSRITNFMILPTMACQASCSYCFAKKTGKMMSHDTAGAAIDFIEMFSAPKEDINLTFHGGEPLLAGYDFYKWILPIVRQRFGRRIHIAIQSNLWAMDESLAELFAEYMVAVSTSLDGPEDMCDSQRGEGYYERTMTGIEALRKRGIPVRVITTFSSGGSDRAAEVYNKSVLPYAVHAAVPADSDEYILLPEIYKKVLIDTYEAYKSDISHNRILTLDAMAEGVLKGKGALCTFTNCLGSFVAIDPDGDMYSCQRFAGYKEYRIGNIMNHPSEEDITNSPGYKRLKLAEEKKSQGCRGCGHYEYCKGGCLYNAIISGSERDPYCDSYNAVFDRMERDMALEMGASMLGAGGKSEPVPAVLAMAGDRKHPADIRKTKELLKYAVEAGKKIGKPEALCIRKYPKNELNKLYLHITNRCPLHCDHCYIYGGEEEFKELPAERIAEVVQEAADNMFHSVVITGGEPLVYPGWDKLCDLLDGLDMKGTKLVLRTAFSFGIDREKMIRLLRLFDRIIVSVDGDKKTHDRRRGAGQYDITVGNLRLAMSLSDDHSCSLGISAVLTREEADGEPGNSISRIARELGINDVRIRSILPIGRGKTAEQEIWQSCADEVLWDDRFAMRDGCGLGHNLFVKADGSAYPCYAWCEPEIILGDLSKCSLGSLLTDEGLFKYQCYSVDTNRKCQSCEVRYLCGGICKAWLMNKTDPDSEDFDCSVRKAFFEKMLHS
ncbi:MAG: radical SAM protein [Eubacterium sp.]|nr:radical SAM protein [Eubacterium sp.]